MASNVIAQYGSCDVILNHCRNKPIGTEISTKAMSDILEANGFNRNPKATTILRTTGIAGYRKDGRNTYWVVTQEMHLLADLPNSVRRQAISFYAKPVTKSNGKTEFLRHRWKRQDWQAYVQQHLYNFDLQAMNDRAASFCDNGAYQTARKAKKKSDKDKKADVKSDAAPSQPKSGLAIPLGMSPEYYKKTAELCLKRAELAKQELAIKDLEEELGNE